MSDILLAKPNLDASWLDASVGEAHVVRDALLSIFDVSACDLPKLPSLFEYLSPQGYKPLVQLLEQKYQAPVIITNGAKNALGAVCFALKQMSKDVIGMRSPYWCLLPPLIEMHGLNWKSGYEDCDTRLLVLPNNPDNWMEDEETIQQLEEESRWKDISLIHDAVYHSHIYLPASHKLGKIGDVQIYSSSKSFGLSSLRVGWIVTSNTRFYKHILHYMEHMTVGVSVISQIFLYDLMNRMHGYPTLTDKFEQTAAASLRANKLLLKQIDPEILEVPANLEDVAGMFLWTRIKDLSLLERAKICAIDGTHFGMPGYVRMNIALPIEQIQEIVTRLNAIKEQVNV